MRSTEGYPESPKFRPPKKSVSFGLIIALCPERQRLSACISSRIPTVIQVTVYDLINCSWFNEPFAVSLYQSVYLGMHGLIFETSIWLLAGSTRYFTDSTCDTDETLQHSGRSHAKVLNLGSRTNSEVLLIAHSRKCFVDSQCANSDAQLLAHLKFICPTPSQASFRCTTVSTSKKIFFSFVDSQCPTSQTKLHK